MPIEDAALPLGPFAGPEDFARLIRSALDAAVREGWREWVWSDPDFADWPLGERSVAEALQQWSAAGRRLTLLAERFDVFERHHARFVHWRRMWGHIVEARVCRGPGLPTVPSAIWTPAWVLRRLDVERCNGNSSNDALSRRMLREAQDECLRHSRAGFPITTLGL
jgi:hypothetical protein